MPNFPNLPKVQTTRTDGGLRVQNTNNNPKVLLLGTAPSGPGDEIFDARDLGAAREVFGQSSELYKGLVETKKAYGAGANIYLYRIGTEAAELQLGTLASSSGIIKALIRDRSSDVGTTYKASYNNTSGYLWMYNELGTLVYSNDPGRSIDLGEIEIRGDFTKLSGIEFGDTANGDLASSVELNVAGALSTHTWTDPNVGPAADNLIGKYEAFQDAYRLLESEDVDIVVPLNVYLDDPNVSLYVSGTSDDTAANLNNPFFHPSGCLSWFKETAPAQGSTTGKYVYQWATNDLVPADGNGNNWADRDARLAADFHEVNFAHQLANFCYQQTRNESTCFGVIGLRPPVSYGLADIHAWIGQPPVKNSTGVITSDGYGILGYPSIGGSTASKIAALCHDGGLVNGRSPGYFATATEFLDDTALTDDSGNSIDIGAYLNVVGEWPLHLNSYGSVQGYSGSAATIYAGMIGRLDEKNAPTNELAVGVRIPYRGGKQRWDDLTAAHIVMMQQRPSGAYVLDAATFAREASDYRRLTTVRLVGLAEDVIRAVGIKYIGKASTAYTKAGFESDIEEELQKLVKRGYLNKFDFNVTTTAVQDILGQAHVKLLLVVPNELRQVFSTVSLGQA
jgi:hypothetical protein